MKVFSSVLIVTILEGYLDDINHSIGLVKLSHSRFPIAALDFDIDALERTRERIARHLEIIKTDSFELSQFAESVEVV